MIFYSLIFEYLLSLICSLPLKLISIRYATLSFHVLLTLRSLRLSDNDNTPEQIALFLSHGLSLCQLPHLKSLTLDHMHSETTIYRMMIEWQYPIHLTHLNITNCRILSNWNIFYTLINNIWSLPKLTHCQLDINVVDDVYSTLEVLSIKNMRYNLREVISLFSAKILYTLPYVFNDYDMLFPKHDQITKLCFLNQNNQMLYEHADYLSSFSQSIFSYFSSVCQTTI